MRTLATGLAWLAVTRRFPGQRFFEWALMQPLAVPAYLMGFVFVALRRSGAVLHTSDDWPFDPMA